MPDREKVIKEFELFVKEFHPACTSEGVELDMFMEVFALLKEREPVEPAMDEDTPGHWVVLENCSNAGVYCSECNTRIFDHYPMKKKFSYFCPHCGTRMEGQAVKLDD